MSRARKSEVVAPPLVARTNWVRVAVVCVGVAAAVIAFVVLRPAASATSVVEGARAASEGARSPTEAPAKAVSADATIANTTPAPTPAPAGMVWIPGGEFSMGTNESCESLCSMPGVTRDALPIHRVHVDGFWMDATEVTNEQFQAFVAATGYVTVAERVPTQEEFPDAPPENLVAGSTVFLPTKEPVALNDYFQWWTYVHGANWRHPLGPDSDLRGREKYPVVQVAYDDAVAYATWAQKRLPTEAEWEFAARGGLSGAIYPWGDELKIDGKFRANIYEGKFPVEGGDTGEDGFVGIAPVAQYAANGYGVHDVAGNVWEWCSDWYRVDTYARQKLAGGVARNPRGPETGYDPAEPTEQKRVHRGGSFLCTDQYCTRYMVGTRGKGEVSTASNHLGFRCAKPVVASSTSR